MNCFPCKGPTCNSCSKFDRLLNAVNQQSKVICPACGGRVDLFEECCLVCGRVAIAPPGKGVAASQ